MDANMLEASGGEGAIGLRPRFRTDLVATLAEEEGVSYVDVVDPTRGNRFRFYDFEYAIAREMDGERTLAEIAAWAQARFGFETSPADLTVYAGKLEDLGYLLSGGPIAAGLVEPGIGGTEQISDATPLAPPPGGSGTLEFGEIAPLDLAAPATAGAVMAEALELGPPETAERPIRAQADLTLDDVGLEGAPVASPIELDSGAVLSAEPIGEPTFVPPPIPIDRGLAEQISSPEGRRPSPPMPPSPYGEGDDASALIAEVIAAPANPAAPPDPLAPTAFALHVSDVVQQAAVREAEASSPLIGGAPAAPSVAALVAQPKPSRAPWIFLACAVVLFLVAGIVLLLNPQLVAGPATGPSSLTGPSSPLLPPAPAGPTPKTAAIRTLASTSIVAGNHDLSFSSAGLVAKLPVAGSDLAAGEVVAELAGADVLDKQAQSDSDRADYYRGKLAKAQSANDQPEIEKDTAKIADHTQAAADEKQKADALRIVASEPVHVDKLLVANGASVAAGAPVVEVGGGSLSAPFTLAAPPPATLASGSVCEIRRTGNTTAILRGTVHSIDGNRVVCDGFAVTGLAAGDEVELLAPGQDASLPADQPRMR